jgi:hypothetical protein
MELSASTWIADLLLRGAVAGVLLFHLVNLALPGPRPAVRAALAMFTLSLLAYLFCQRAELLLALPRPLGFAALALCVSSTAWLWLAARGLFDDGFRLSLPLLAGPIGLVVLGLAAQAPRRDALLAGLGDPGVSALGQRTSAVWVPPNWSRASTSSPRATPGPQRRPNGRTTTRCRSSS